MTADSIDVSQNGTRLRGTAHVRSGVPAGTAFLADGIAEDSANALTESVVEVQQAVITFAAVNYFEPWWVQIIKSLVIFAVIFAILPILIVYERKLLGRFQARYGPNRVGPVRAAAAVGGDRQVRDEGAVPDRRHRSATCSGSRR